MTINELLNDYNELVAQFNNDPNNISKLQVLKSWKASKAKLAERIEILQTKIKPVEVNIDELLGAAERREVPDVNEPPDETPGDETPAPKKRANGKWDGTFERQDNVKLKAVKSESTLGKLLAKCNGTATCDEIAADLSSTAKNIKKQIRAMVRRGYTLNVTDGKIKLDVPS